jgi:6-phosphogluconate dehydrogenase
MGANLARNLARHGHVVAVHNRTAARTAELVAAHGSEGTFVPADTVLDLAASQGAWRSVVAYVTTSGVPVPGFASALAYYDTVRAERLPASLVQGLRDFFGAHTSARVDREGTFHTEWSGDRSERAL